MYLNLFRIILANQLNIGDYISEKYIENKKISVPINLTEHLTFRSKVLFDLFNQLEDIKIDKTLSINTILKPTFELFIDDDSISSSKTIEMFYILMNNEVTFISALIQKTFTFYSPQKKKEQLSIIYKEITELIELASQYTYSMHLHRTEFLNKTKTVQDKNVEYILNLVELLLLRLYAEIEILIQNKKCDQLNYVDASGECGISKDNIEILTYSENIFKAKNLIHSSKTTFKAKNTLKIIYQKYINPRLVLINYTSYDTIKNTISALESFIFIKEFIKGENYYTYDELTSSIFIQKLIEKYVNNVNKDLDQFNYGYERYDYLIEQINTLNSLGFNEAKEDLSLSLPRMYIRHILNLKDRYGKMMTFKFHKRQSKPPINSIENSNLKPINIKKELTINEKLIIANKHLSIFSGQNLNGEKIMTDENFNSLKKEVSYIIEYDKIPENFTPINRINLPNQFISFTFYNLYKDLFPEYRIKNYWIEFLYSFIQQFCSAKIESFKSKFSVKPINYFNDLDSLKKNKYSNN